MGRGESAAQAGVAARQRSASGVQSAAQHEKDQSIQERQAKAAEANSEGMKSLSAALMSQSSRSGASEQPSPKAKDVSGNKKM